MPPLSELFAYDAWPSRAHLDWHPGSARGDSPYDAIDFHVDLGCGRTPKARIGVDRYPDPGVAVLADLDSLRVHGIPREPGGDAAIHHDDGSYSLWTGEHELYDLSRKLPFDDDSIQSIISHHAFEHIGEGFLPLMDEIYRVLVPQGILRVITPLFPSWNAVSDPDHKRWFMADDNNGQPISTWDSFCGTPEHLWSDSFAHPYTRARFQKLEQVATPRDADQAVWWTPRDARELRIALQVVK